MTSSRSLGLYAYFQFRCPRDTAGAVAEYRDMARNAGLSCEVYPSFANCLRRPLGDGGYLLTNRGVLRDFADQMLLPRPRGDLPDLPRGRRDAPRASGRTSIAT